MTEPTPTIEDVQATTYGGPVARTVEPRGGRVGLRWVVALIVVALVAATTAAGAWFLAGQSGTSSLAGWVPSDSVVYSEGRLDLPGDQRQQLGNLLAHFPGFKDQSILDDKIAETLDRAIRGATNDRHDYGTEIRPWFGGELAASVGPLPAVAASDATPPAFRFLLLAAVKDRAGADGWVTKIASESSAPLATETYKGVTIRSTAESGGRAGAVAVLDRVLLAGDLASVKAAIDTGGTSGLAANTAFASATARLDGDHLGATWLNLRAYLRWAASVGGPAGGSLTTKLLDLMPDWVAADVRATNGDALTGRSVGPHLAAFPTIARGPSVLASHVPGNALALLDGHDLGTVIETGLQTWRSMPEMASALSSIDAGLKAFGGEDAALGWVGEAALVGIPDGDGVTGGLLVAAKDRDKADAFVREVRNLIALGGATMGISSHDEDDHGTTITIVDAGNLAGVLGDSAAASAVPGKVEIAFATRDGVVTAGTPAFVHAALDTSSGSSLGANARFSGAIARVGADSTSLGWLDITAVRAILERTVSAGPDRDRYEQDIAPYLEPLDVLVYGQVAGSEVDTGTVSLITK